MLSRRTKIVATIGPKSRDPEVLRALIQAGVDVVRLNFSHGSKEDHAEVVAEVRRLEEELGRPIAVLQDLQGPKIRIGRFKAGRVELRPGQRFVLVTEPVEGDAERVSVSYPGLPTDVRPGQTLLLDDGHLVLEVTSVRPDAVETVVRVGGVLSDHKGLNVPGADLSIPALTEKDLEDLAFGARIGVDWVAMSFVRSRDDLLLCRHYLNRYGSHARLIAKIEKPQAVERFEAILAEADGIMIARGDLGVEMPLAEVPLVQKRLIRRTLHAGKPVITATQMLESMVQSPTPTRAEVTDVANAIFDGTDAVMLSAETAAGAYPVEAVRVMDRVAREAEASPEYAEKMVFLRPEPEHTVQDAIALASVDVAESLPADAIVVFTASGSSAWRVARFRPRVPIVALTPSPTVRRQLVLTSGVYPRQSPDPKDSDDMVRIALAEVKQSGLLEPEATIAITAGVPFGVSGTTNLLRVERVR